MVANVHAWLPRLDLTGTLRVHFAHSVESGASDPSNWEPIGALSSEADYSIVWITELRRFTLRVIVPDDERT
jgi:hypothetical protein